MLHRPLCRPLCRRALLVALPALLLGCAGGMTTGAQDAAKDELAREQYYEEAAKTYYDGGKYQQAVVMWDKVLESRPDDQWAKFGLGKSLQMIGTVDSLRRAEAVLEPLLQLPWVHPTRGDITFEVQTTLAMVYSELADYYDRDIRALEARMEEDPNVDERVLEQQARRQRQVRDNLLTKSIPLWQAVLAQSPENQYALAGLAKANLVAGSTQAGIHYADRYIALARQSREGWRRNLDAWRQQMKGDVKPEQVEFYREKIRGTREKEMGMLLLLGAVYMRQDRFQEAVQRYDEILKMDPARVAALVERAQAYAGLGRYERAVQDLEEYLKLTDARTQREARINAAELLERYKAIADRRPVPTRALR